MKKTISLLLLAAISLTLAASAATKTITTGKFNKISVSTAVKVHFTKGSSTQVRLEADKDIFSDVEVTTQDGLLSIENKARTSTNHGSNSETLNVWITAPEVTGFKATVGSDITIESSTYSVSSPLNIDISVGSSFKANSLSAPSIIFKNTVGSTATVSDLKSDGDLTLENTVGSKMTVRDIVAKGVFDFTSGPSGNTTITNVSAANANLKFGPTDHFDINNKIDAKYLTVSGGVNANITLNGITSDFVDASGAYGCDITLAGKTDKCRGKNNGGSVSYSNLVTRSPVEVSRSGFDYNVGSYQGDSIRKQAAEVRKQAAEIRRQAAEVRRQAAETRRQAAETRKNAAAGNYIINGSVNDPAYWNEYSTKNEKRQTSTLKTGTIKEIKGSSGISVYYRQGPLKPVEITTPESRKNDISVYMEGTTLNIEKVKGNSWKDEFVVTVQAPDVNTFNFSSGCRLTFTDDYNINGTFNLDMSSGSTFTANSIKASKIAIDLSSGCNISVPALKASTDVLIDLSSGSNFSTQDVEAQNKITLDLSSGVNCNIGSLKAPQFLVDLSSGSSFSGSQFVADQIKVDVSSAAKATLSDIQADHITVDASSVSTVTLAGRCNTLSVEGGVLSNSANNGYHSKGRVNINIDNLEVKNGVPTATGSDATFNDYDFNYDFESDQIKNLTTKLSGSDRQLTEKEKVAAAVEALKALGLTDEQIRRALSNSGLDTDLIETTDKDKEKKEYTDDDLIP